MGTDQIGPEESYGPLAKLQRHVINPTNPRGALNDGVEDRLYVGGRAADDTEDFGGGCLMLQGLTQFCVALLDLFEQAYIFDSDDRLVGEGFDERNLLVGERINFQVVESLSLRSQPLAHKRDGQPHVPSAHRPEISGNSSRCRHYVVNMDRLPVDNGVAGLLNHGVIGRVRPPSGGSDLIARHFPHHIAFDAVESQHHLSCTAGIVFRNNIQHRLYICRGAGDHAKYLTGRGLLFERLSQFAIAIL